MPDPIDETTGESVIKYNSETQTVEVPLWYWLELTRYINYMNITAE